MRARCLRVVCVRVVGVWSRVQRAARTGALARVRVNSHKVLTYFVGHMCRVGHGSAPLPSKQTRCARQQEGRALLLGTRPSWRIYLTTKTNRYIATSMLMKMLDIVEDEDDNVYFVPSTE